MTHDGVAGFDFQGFGAIYTNTIAKFTAIIPDASIQGAWKSNNMRIFFKSVMAFNSVMLSLESFVDNARHSRFR